jgi:hypothetical protein
MSRELPSEASAVEGRIASQLHIRRHGFGVWKGDRRMGPGVIEESEHSIQKPILERNDEALCRARESPGAGEAQSGNCSYELSG